MRRLLPFLLVFLAACEAMPTVDTPPGTGSARPVETQAEMATRRFVEVAGRIEPIAESQCDRLTQGQNCDYLIVVDDRPGQEANAFQTLDAQGRPIIAFNLALIASVQNADELAFVMAHESAHHILGHLAKVEEDAAIAAVIFSGIAEMSGASAADVRSAQELGASVGARTFSKEYELEADQMGTILTIMAGYDPVRGADFFLRLPDPGDRFMGSHPSNAARRTIVQRTAAAYRTTN